MSKNSTVEENKKERSKLVDQNTAVFVLSDSCDVRSTDLVNIPNYVLRNYYLKEK